MKLEARPWTPQDLLDDLQGIIDEESDNYLNTRRTTLEMALAYLKEHFAEEESGWIPVTEKLPTTDGRFMVTIKGRSGKPHVEMRNFHAGSQKWESQYGWREENVLAWQARPRPYGYKPKGG